MSIVVLLIMFAAVSGSAVMVGVIGYLIHRISRIESGGGSTALVEQVERLREDLLSAQEEVAALSERLDFTERLLMSGAEGERPEDSP